MGPEPVLAWETASVPEVPDTESCPPDAAVAIPDSFAMEPAVFAEAENPFLVVAKGLRERPVR